MCDDSSATSITSYIIMKCANIDSLQQCIKSNEWAWRRRSKQLDPHGLLVSAHEKGDVILVFSVNNQHGWHGFCQSGFKIKATDTVRETDKFEEAVQNLSNTASADDTEPEVATDVTSEGMKEYSEECNTWNHFPVEWLVHFQHFNTYACLDFKCTQHLTLPDGTPLHRARNWQQLSADTGKQLCELIKEHHMNLTVKKEKQQTLNKPESFFKSDQNVSSLREKYTWETVLTKITNDLGKVHLACPFGSQRYNCNTPSSDLDIFIVYQAKTVDMLGLDPPKQTIKNSHHEDVDYSVLELQRYCELLVKGDAKCVETLFLSGSPVVVKESPAWKQLCTNRKLLLTGQCLDKYIKEIKGTTGLKQFQRWRDSNPSTEALTPKLAKLGYIVLRLLQNARDMAKHSDMAVFRDETSLEREELMALRKGDYTYSKFMSVVERYMEEIEASKGQLEQDTHKAKMKIQDWLIECRIQDLQQDSRLKIT